jgi:hypothetical protein
MQSEMFRDDEKNGGNFEEKMAEKFKTWREN